MKKIFKIIRQNIIGFIISGIIFGGIGVYAVTVIAASNVGYTDNASLGATNVQDAIDKLNTKATTKVVEAEAKCPSGNVCTKTWAKIGDYVSMIPTSTSYTTNTSATGYTSSQTLNPSELNLWRVIRINSDGTIEVVSEYVSSVDVYFEGKTGYQNLVGYLNTIARQYENKTYTVSSRHIGYSNQTSYITDTSVLDSTTALQIESTSSSNVTIKTEAKGLGDMEYETDYNLVNTAIGSLKAYKAGTTTTSYYWLASRNYHYLSSTGWIFYGRGISLGGSMSINYLYSYGGSFNSRSNSNAIRPIVTLKSGLSPTGAGTSSNPYKLS